MARRGRNPEVIAGRVNADGTIAAGDGFSVQKTGTGVYVIVFPPGFRVVSGTTSFGAQIPNDTTAVGAFTSSSMSVWPMTGATGIDAAFSFIAVGIQR
jgi:hypothetical protein